MPGPIAALLALLLPAGCALVPVDYDARAAAAGLTAGELPAGGFVLRTYRTGPLRPGARLHVYLDGDGRPWRADPTTARRVVLDMMRQDANPAILIGRPCYYGTAGQPGCAPALWRAQRYGPVVVDALTEAIRQTAEAAPGSTVTLIGYSGGGALAALIAPRVAAVDTVVTVAANLDIDAWTRHHGEPGLAGSLNPAEQPPLPASIRQLHLAGGRDRNVPVSLNEAFLSRQRSAAVKVYPDQSHGCCWDRVWPEVLAGL